MPGLVIAHSETAHPQQHSFVCLWVNMHCYKRKVQSKVTLASHTWEVASIFITLLNFTTNRDIFIIEKTQGTYNISKTSYCLAVSNIFTIPCESYVEVMGSWKSLYRAENSEPFYAQPGKGRWRHANSTMNVGTSDDQQAATPCVNVNFSP